MPTRGMVLGKFMPPHRGHQYLVDVARGYADELTVVVGTLAKEPIPGALRFAWMQELFPSCRVVHLTDENPQDPSEHPDFWEIWRTSLLRVLPGPVDVVFASESYGHKLAEVLGARFIPVDPNRVTIPVSGTAIRNDPMAHWDWLPTGVRPYFVRRVAVLGAESTGKTTLANALAKTFDTVCAPEFARTYLESRGGQIEPADIEVIARGQPAVEEASARQAQRVLFCDTDLYTTQLWSEMLFGSAPEGLKLSARARRYDLVLVTDPEVPFAPDLVRYRPDERRAFFRRLCETLEANGVPYHVIAGDPEARLHQAVQKVTPLLSRPR